MEASLRKLKELIEDRSERGRNLLFRHVCDLFFHGKFPNDGAYRETLLEVLEIIRPHVDVSVRRELAGHLYSMERPPEPLLRLAITDIPEVAEPVLHFANLPESLVLELIETGSDYICERLAKRRDLGHAAEKALKARQSRKPEGQATETEKRDSTSATAPAARSAAVPAAPVPRSAASEILPETAAIQHQAQKASEDRGKLQDFTRAQSDWQWETDRNGVLVYMSDTAAEAFGRPVTALIGQRLSTLLKTPKGVNQPSIDHYLQSWRPFDGLRATTADRDTGHRWVLAGIPHFERDSERFSGFRGVAKSMQKPSPKFHLQASAPAVPAKNDGDDVPLAQPVIELLQTLSHEIRTPLNAILGFSEMMETGTFGQVNANYLDCLNRIQVCGHLLNEFINEILEDARLQKEKGDVRLRPASLSQLLRNSIDAVKGYAERCRINVMLPPSTLQMIVVTEPDVAERCLTRLLRIAIMESQPGATLNVDVATNSNAGVEITFPLVAGPSSAMSQFPALKSVRLQRIRDLAETINANISSRDSGDGSDMLSLTFSPPESMQNAEFSLDLNKIGFSN